MMLPYLEQQPIYNAINFNWVGGYSVGGAINSTIWNTRLGLLACPSDGPAASRPSTSYYGSVGTATYDWWGGIDNNLSNNPPSWKTVQQTTGIFTKYGSYSVADVSDGTSNTIAFSEGLVGGPTNTSSQKNSWRNGVTGVTLGQLRYVDALEYLPNVLTALQTCNQAWKSNTNISQNVGQYWGWGDVGYTMFNTIVTPNSTQYQWHACRDGCGGCSPDSASYTNATSNHSGGVNAAMADGSVRFIKNSIQMRTWMVIGTRNGGEVVSADQY